VTQAPPGRDAARAGFRSQPISKPLRACPGTDAQGRQGQLGRRAGVHAEEDCAREQVVRPGWPRRPGVRERRFREPIGILSQSSGTDAVLTVRGMVSHPLRELLRATSAAAATIEEVA